MNPPPLVGAKRRRVSVQPNEPRPPPNQPSSPGHASSKNSANLDEDMANPEDEANDPATIRAARRSPPPPARFVRTPITDGAYRVAGVTRKELLAVASAMTETLWDLVNTCKFFALFPGDKFRSDPTWATSKMEEIFTYVLNDGTTPCVYAATPTDPRRTSHYVYITFLIHGLTMAQYERIFNEHSPVISTPLGTVVMYPYDLKPGKFAAVLGHANIPATPEGETLVRNTVRGAISAPGSDIAAKIHEIYDNVPIYWKSTPEGRLAYINSTVEVRSYYIGRKEQKDTTRFVVFIDPPTLDTDQHREWISVLNQTATARYIVCDGELTVMEPFNCLKCTAKTHPTGMCQYPSLPGYHQTVFPEDESSPDSSTPNQGPVRLANVHGRHGNGGRGGRSQMGFKGCYGNAHASSSGSR